jgi:hypothetical protein
MISSVSRNQLAGMHQYDVSGAQLLARNVLESRWSLGFLSFLARMSRRALRSVSACALPRPSAIASAKVGE